MALHHFDGLDRQSVRAYGAGRWGHDAGDGGVLQIDPFFKGSPQIAVGEDAKNPALRRSDDHQSEPAPRHRQDSLGEQYLWRDRGYGVDSAHDVADVGEQAATQGAARMRAGKIVRSEAAGIEERHCQGIPKGERRGGTGCRGQVVGAGFLGDSRIQVDVGLPRQRR